MYIQAGICSVCLLLHLFFLNPHIRTYSASINNCSEVGHRAPAAPVFDVEVLAQMKVSEGGVSGEGWQHCEQVCIQACQHTHRQSATWHDPLAAPLKPLPPKDKKSQSQWDVLQCAAVPLSEISRVPMEETLGKNSWITAAPADLSWRESEREEKTTCAHT